MVSSDLTINFMTSVQELIPRVEERMHRQAIGHHPDLGAALQHLLSSGGKRIRPTVALLTGMMLGAEIEDLITLSASIELLHTATLVHDDLIDGALLRRGIATLNSRWTPAATVLTGDFIFAQAARLAAETNSVAVMGIFAQTLATIVNGEIAQMFNSRGIANRQEYYERIYAKTASMFELATEAAALLSPADSAKRRAVRTFGYEIGMAFQIVDDILDFTGDQSTVGKPVAGDLHQGLVTLPAICYLELNPDDPDTEFLKLGGYPSGTVIDRLVESIRASGAIRAAMQEARSFVGRGLDALTGMPEGVEKQALINLAQYIVEREL